MEPTIPKRIPKQLLILLGVSLLLVVLVVSASITFFLQNNTQEEFTPEVFPTITPNPTLRQQTQSPYQILTTSPSSNQTNVYSGELAIEITTSQAIISSDNIYLSFSPALSNGYEFTNEFPSSSLRAVVLGNLTTNTLYTVTVLNNFKTPIYSWSFTTGTDTGQGESALRTKLDQQLLSTEYPLSQFVPFENDHFAVGYLGPMTLRVRIKNPNIELVKEEVQNWVRSKNIDPDSHQYVYVNDF